MNEQAGGTDWVAIARLDRVRGNRGELAATSLSWSEERFEALTTVVLFGPGFGERRCEVESVWWHEGRPVFKFRGIDSISQAQPLAGAEVRVPKAERRPMEGGYFLSDLAACEVIERSSGRRLGQVTGWEESSGQVWLHVEGGLIVPFARRICVGIDVAARRIEVELPEGLEELNRS